MGTPHLLKFIHQIRKIGRKTKKIKIKNRTRCRERSKSHGTFLSTVQTPKRNKINARACLESSYFPSRRRRDEYKDGQGCLEIMSVSCGTRSREKRGELPVSWKRKRDAGNENSCKRKLHEGSPDLLNLTCERS